MEKKQTSTLYKIIKSLVRFFYGKMEVVGLENLPEDNAIIVGNHCQLNGPIAGELFLQDNCYIWCAGQMMDLKEVPEYAFTDFWSQKSKWIQPFYKLASYLIAPLSVCIFNNARTIAVYRDMRIMSTFKDSIKLLQQGANILIFPEIKAAPVGICRKYSRYNCNSINFTSCKLHHVVCINSTNCNDWNIYRIYDFF